MFGKSAHIVRANVLYKQKDFASPWTGLMAAAGTWLISILVGATFYQHIESRSSYWQSLLIDPVQRMPLRLLPAQRSR